MKVFDPRPPDGLYQLSELTKNSGKSDVSRSTMANVAGTVTRHDRIMAQVRIVENYFVVYGHWHWQT